MRESWLYNNYMYFSGLIGFFGVQRRWNGTPPRLINNLVFPFRMHRMYRFLSLTYVTLRCYSPAFNVVDFILSKGGKSEALKYQVKSIEI